LISNSDGILARTHPIAIGQAATHNIPTLVLASEVIPLVVTPLFIGIVGRAGPDLELRPVLVHTILDVQTLVAEDANGATGDSPLLRSSAGAGLDGDLGAVGVGGGGQAFT
jgi:hypothetical protein